jgi:hypothetical protein
MTAVTAWYLGFDIYTSDLAFALCTLRAEDDRYPNKLAMPFLRSTTVQSTIYVVNIHHDSMYMHSFHRKGIKEKA